MRRKKREKINYNEESKWKLVECSFVVCRSLLLEDQDTDKGGTDAVYWPAATRRKQYPMSRST